MYKYTFCIRHVYCNQTNTVECAALLLLAAVASVMIKMCSVCIFQWQRVREPDNGLLPNGGQLAHRKTRGSEQQRPGERIPRRRSRRYVTVPPMLIFIIYIEYSVNVILHVVRWPEQRRTSKPTAFSRPAPEPRRPPRGGAGRPEVPPRRTRRPVADLQGRAPAEAGESLPRRQEEKHAS